MGRDQEIKGGVKSWKNFVPEKRKSKRAKTGRGFVQENRALKPLVSSEELKGSWKWKPGKLPREISGPRGTLRDKGTRENSCQ